MVAASFPENNEPCSETLELIEALTYQRSLDAPRFLFHFCEKIAIVSFAAAENISMRSCEHFHEAYEFIIPHTPLPYLTNDEAVYFGEVGYIYPVQSGRKHGTKYPVNNVSYTSVAVEKDFFDIMLSEKGYHGFVFNSVIPCSDNLLSLIKMFNSEYAKGKDTDITNKLLPLRQIICAEIIDLAVKNAGDDRKAKAIYQKGIRLAADYINEHFSESITIEELASMCGLSLNYFSLCFRNTFGETPKIYITKMRLSKAKTLLEFSDMQIKDIAKLCGFQKFNSFSCSFKKYIGLTPSEYREGLIKRK